MDELVNNIKNLPEKLSEMTGKQKASLFGAVGAVALLVGLVALVATGADRYEYAYSNLTPEDSTEAAATLKASGVPFKLEAGGTAIAVPASRVPDARLLLATAGIPRSGQAGFEIFDKGDLGVSQFTQRVNLRRAIEGELAQSISRLEQVRTARVHVTLAEKGLFREDDNGASAAVVLGLYAGRTLGRRELAGVRHLVSSAVPGLKLEAVSIVDGSGKVLAGTEDWQEDAHRYQRQLERDLEARVVSLLTPVVGAKNVVARITAEVDNRQMAETIEDYDPDRVAVRSERTVSTEAQSNSQKPVKSAGAAANQPLNPAADAQNATSNNNKVQSDETRNFEISKVVKQTQSRTPRLMHLSAAVLVAGPDGQPLPAEKIQEISALVKRAIGFDAKRGDQFEIGTQVFLQPEPEPPVGVDALLTPQNMAMAAGAALLGIIAGAFLLRRRKKAAVAEETERLLQPGKTVAQLTGEGLEEDDFDIPEEDAEIMQPLALPGDMDVRDRARGLVKQDPKRAFLLLRAWLNEEQNYAEESDND